MEAPETRYIKTPDGAHIAYQVFGDGPFDLVYVPGFASNVEYMWRVEPFARGLPAADLTTDTAAPRRREPGA